VLIGGFFSIAHKAQFLEYYATVGFLLPQEGLCFSAEEGAVQKPWTNLLKYLSGGTALSKILNSASGRA
jgi:hypothetical protein